jgi:regulator of sigma E protease
MDAFTDILAYAGVLAVALGIHEAGHFVAAKRLGLIARIFSLGFGKVLFSYEDRAGTAWQVRALPLGGFIKLDEERLAALPPSRRLAIYLAGPAANIAAGIVLVAAAGMTLGTPMLKSLEISVQVIPQIVSTMLGALAGVFSGDIANLSGPVGTAVASGDAVRTHGAVMFVALFSWSIGILNLLPIPLLDGGQIAFCCVEMAVGKLSRAALAYAAWAGKSFIGCMIFIGVASDLMRMVS